jgi:hypothetical protein
MDSIKSKISGITPKTELKPASAKPNKAIPFVAAEKPKGRAARLYEKATGNPLAKGVFKAIKHNSTMTSDPTTQQNFEQDTRLHYVGAHPKKRDR